MSFFQTSRESDKVIHDPTNPIFQGETEVKLYNDRIIGKGVCWNCQGKIYIELELTKGEAAQSTRDPQYQKNLVSHAEDLMQERHQCGLLDEGKISAAELDRRLNA